MDSHLFENRSVPIRNDASDEDKHIAVELDFDAAWRLYENFELGATVGVLFPGPVFEPYREPVFGTEIRGIIRF